MVIRYVSNDSDKRGVGGASLCSRRRSRFRMSLLARNEGRACSMDVPAVDVNIILVVIMTTIRCYLLTSIYTYRYSCHDTLIWVNIYIYIYISKYMDVLLYVDKHTCIYIYMYIAIFIHHNNMHEKSSLIIPDPYNHISI